MGIFSLIYISTKIVHDVKLYKKNSQFKGKEIQISFANVVVAIWLLCYIAISMIFTTGLLLFHIKIMKQDKTTKEELKKLFMNPFLNPYERNLKQNLKNVLIPNIKTTSILDELKINKNNYNKFMKVEEKEKKNEYDKNTDVAEVSVEIENGMNKNRKVYKEKKSSKKKFKEKYKNKKEEMSEKKKIIEKPDNTLQKEDNYILNKMITNEDKSSNNDIMTSHTNDIIKRGNKKEEKEEPIDFEIKNEEMKDVEIIENNDINILPPPSNKKTEDKNNKEVFKRIHD